MLSHWPPVELQALIRDKCRCVFCGLDGRGSFEAWVQVVFRPDHLIPLSAGGDHSLDNLVTACWPCNDLKRRFDPRQEGDERFSNEERREVWIARAREEILARRGREYTREDYDEMVAKLDSAGS
jgi:5-methylcytosine-specific restriction endonuclease McrA